MSENIIYAAQSWPTNAAMIADLFRLGYLGINDFILDPTYGRGTWWRVIRPRGLYCVDRAAAPWWDFRDMRCWYDISRPLPDETFDAVTFDPPYVSVGGRETTSIHKMHDAYGMDGAPTTPQGVQDDIDAGLAECFRVVKKGGIVLCKCQDYVTSGKLWPGTYLTQKAAYAVGFQLVDRIEHISGPRPQPGGRGPQQHARRNYSTLFVLRRPKR